MGQQKKYLIVIGGATAVGKTAVAIALAQYFKTVVLSFDSRQFYQEMSIGTAKPTMVEMANIPHYFINSHSIAQDYSVGQFEKEALSTLDILFKTHDVVVAVGGTGLYIKALCEGIDEFPEVPEAIKKELQQVLENQGIKTLQDELKAKDEVYFNAVDTQNPVRLLRALSIIRATGKPFSSFLGQKKNIRTFQPIYILIDLPRPILYERINQRVNNMIQQGLLDEAKKLYPFKNLNALQTVGYQELFDYFDGKINLPKAIELIQQHSRNYAKRQCTWFKKDDKWQSFAPEELSKIIIFINEKLVYLVVFCVYFTT